MFVPQLMCIMLLTRNLITAKEQHKLCPSSGPPHTKCRFCNKFVCVCAASCKVTVRCDKTSLTKKKQLMCIIIFPVTILTYFY